MGFRSRQIGKKTWTCLTSQFPATMPSGGSSGICNGVKDNAFEALTSDASDVPLGSSWSISVMSEHIAIFAHLDGDEKRGDGRP